MLTVQRNGTNIYCNTLDSLKNPRLEESIKEQYRAKIQQAPFFAANGNIHYAEFERWGKNEDCTSGLNIAVYHRAPIVTFKFANPHDIGRILRDFRVDKISDLVDEPATVYFFKDVPVQCMSATPTYLLPAQGTHGYEGMDATQSADAEKKFLAQSAEKFLQLSTRIATCLEKSKINTLGDLVQKSEADLRKIRGMGNTSLQELYRRLNLHGLNLKEDVASKETIDDW